MKKFNASDLSKKPSQVFAAARAELALIQHKDRKGGVVEEFVILPRDIAFSLVDNNSLADGCHGDTKELIMWNLLQPNNCHCGTCEECKDVRATYEGE